MGATLSTIDSILKTQYLGPIREQLNMDVTLLSRIEKDKESITGKGFTVPLHYGRNEGVGAKAEGATLPTAVNQQFKETIIPMRYLYGRGKLTGQSMKASANSTGAFARAIDVEMKGIQKDIKSELNRMLFGDGSGVLATCGTTSNSTTVVVGSTAKLRAGMVVDIIVTADGTTSTGAVGRTITSIASSTTFVISGAAITTDNTFSVYRNGARGIEVMGLSGIITNTGTLQSIDPATYAFWKANVLSNSGTNRAITDILLQTGMDTVSQNSDGEVSAWYTTYGVKRAIQALLQADRQFVNTMEYKAGFKTISYNDIPIIADKDAVANTIFGADEKMLKMYMMADFDFMEQDGAILSRISGEDAYEFVLYGYMELGTHARNAHVKIADITEA